MTRTRKPRKRVTTDLGRSVMQRERQRLLREQQMLAEKLAEDAQRARKSARRNGTVTAQDIRDAQSRALQRSVVRRLGGVLASEGVTASLAIEQLDDTEPIDAWTDFSRIYVGYHWLGNIKETSAVLRGAVYHEGGHCRFTMPYQELESQAAGEMGIDLNTIRNGINVNDLHRAWNGLEDQRMETAVVSDSPRKVGYFVPMVMAEICPGVDALCDNYPLLIWRKYLAPRVLAEARKLFVFKYDQRGMDGNAIATQLETIVDGYVMGTTATVLFQRVLEFHAVLETIDAPAYDLSDENAGHENHRYRGSNDDVLVIPIDPSMLDQDGAQAPGGEAPEINDLNDVMKYVGPEGVLHVMEILAASMLSPETLITVIYSIPSPSPQPGKGKGDKKSKSKSGKQMGADARDPNEDEDEDEDKDGEGEGDQEGEDGGDPKGEKRSKGRKGKRDKDGNRESVAPSKEGNAEPTPVPEDNPIAGNSTTSDHEEAGGTEGTHGDDGSGSLYADEQEEDFDGGLTDQDLQGMLAAAKHQRLQDPSLSGDVSAFTSVAEEQGSSLDIYTGGVDTDPGRIASANRLAEDLVRSFQEATVEKEPSWHEEQRRGVINVQRYLTRQPGDTEFFRGWVDEGNPGTDCSVSLLLDYSGSMGGSVQALAQVAYGCKAACDQLDIPCTVLLWDTDARVLWDSSERAEYLPIINSAGGTNPIKALNDVRNQRCGKTTHIVMVMTDDAWESSAPLINAYHEEGRIWIGLGYTSGGWSSHIGESMEKKGFDKAASITDLMTIPKFLEAILVEYA